ncbi:DUF892 family protein [Mucilaginibacter sp. L3T2-6]|uniref:DUF892 family protein n=1 Tax=Mucilaginibacter sp. L3T2-6 TaxID=3062491 RepID=UPI002675F1F2|nr:DUF892 family protein [Mucilaginibacter sp. L3T2-6]MDO3645257.1 DUF892 family protein [Mucilaginibacter sp. L3T2-6]MDV6217709.1 DUF892 family protein [Mucilaginibacter sp. L3T2-6]
MNKQSHKRRPTALHLNPEQLRGFFLAHLNRIRCAKSHLYERLPELEEQADFKDLKQAISETWEAIGRQIARMDEIYVLLEEEPPKAYADELVEFLENGFSAIFQDRATVKLRDLSIIFYLSLIESIELVSFQILHMAAVDFPGKQIRQLLQKNFDESKADRVLFLQITAVYIN